MPQLSREHTRLDFARGGQVYASDVRRRIANLHQILADIDFALAAEIEKLKLREGDSERVPALIETLREMHQQRREPFVRRLAELSMDLDGWEQRQQLARCLLDHSL
jgi:hypothetical protein